MFYKIIASLSFFGFWVIATANLSEGFSFIKVLLAMVVCGAICLWALDKMPELE